jgi:shikimate kinase
LTNAEIVDLASRSQLVAEVSFTGSVDDSWAAVEPGWKLINPNVPAAEGIVLEGEFQDPEDWKVLIIPRGERELLPDPEKFAEMAPQFEKAILAMEQGALLVALTENGRAASNALGDGKARRLANDLLVWGARAAGVTGSGPAIVALVPMHSEVTLRRIVQLAEQRGHTTIVTDVWVE